MDFLYGHGTQSSYLEDDMDVFLDSTEMFHTPLTSFPTPEDENLEHDWLNTFLDDPVLNDKMMTDAMQPPCIKSEHSYSINHNDLETSLEFIHHDDTDSDIFSNASALDLTTKSLSTTTVIKTEVTNPDVFLTPAITTTTPTFTITRQPTIIVTTTSNPSVNSPFLTGDTLSFPSIHIKQEPADCLDQVHEQTVNLESIVLPPTPPGSSSDSDGSLSPQRSAPSSPIRQTSLRHSSSTLTVSSKGFTQPLFVNAISPSGVLILSEEEKRTLISEGYPIPTKLPLTKQEEKNLKKIRRKIKNKISAQESRRKKKEYLEALEKRIEAYNHENNDLKKKVENLENNNRSLLGQLQKLQSLVSKMPKAATATQTGTALMVLVFCFAVFLGSMSPSNLNIGYSTKPAMLGFVQPQASSLPQREMMGPQPMPEHDTDNSYTTPNLKSRVLMSVDQEDICDDYRSMLPWETFYSCPMPENTADKKENLPNPGVDLHGAVEIPATEKSTPDPLVVMVVAAGADNNSDSRENLASSFQPYNSMPDVAMIQNELFSHGNFMNISVEFETS